MAFPESIRPYVLGINFKIKMDSLFLRNQLFSRKWMLLSMYVIRY